MRRERVPLQKRKKEKTRRPAQSSSRCTKCNSPPISGQWTNFLLFAVAISVSVLSTPLTSDTAFYFSVVEIVFRIESCTGTNCSPHTHPIPTSFFPSPPRPHPHPISVPSVPIPHPIPIRFSAFPPHPSPICPHPHLIPITYVPIPTPSPYISPRNACFNSSAYIWCRLDTVELTVNDKINLIQQQTVWRSKLNKSNVEILNFRRETCSSH